MVKPRPLERSSIEAYVAIVLGVLGVALPMTWYFRAALIALVIGLAIHLITRSPATIGWPFQKKLVWSVGAALLLMGVSANAIVEDYESAGGPDVMARLVGVAAPSFQIENVSGKPAKQVKAVFALWNRDAKGDPMQFLQVPSYTLDFVRPRQASIPWQMFQPVVGSFKYGNRIFGTILLNCADCEKGRAYAVYITWGKGGWYADMPGARTDTVSLPKGWDKLDIGVWADQFTASIPEGNRKPIRD